MRIFKTRWFGRFARGERLDDSSLAAAVERGATGLVDADLGGGLIKQRIARKGRGRSGGYRVIIACRFGDRAVFLYGFAKNERASIAPGDLEDLRLLARDWLQANADGIEEALKDGAIQEIEYGDET